ncbi:MAG: outer membrane beta-barrel family protein [Saonia sp.]
MQKVNLIFLFFLPSLVYPQTDFSIFGTVVDHNDIPVIIGDALLFAEDNGTLLKFTTITDGKFSFNAIVKGTYRLQISCLGFKDQELAFELNENKLLAIQLVESTTTLDEVEVVSSKKVFTYKNGNLKVNVENPIFSSIPDPLDLLAKLPNLQVSPDRESITIIGKGIPLIYIGNQRISLEEFSSLSTDDISSIEIVRNPSAKYEADGRSVLLITRKISSAEGVKLNFSETASFKRNFNNFFGVNGSYQKNKLTLKGNVAYNNLQTWESNGFEFQILEQDILNDYRALIPVNDRLQINGGVGLFYELNATDYVSMNTNFRLQTDVFTIGTNTFLREGMEENFIVTRTLNDNEKDFISGNMNYNKKLSSTTNLFIGTQYSSFVQKLNTDISNNFNETEFIGSQMRQQKFQLDAIAFRLDLEKEFRNDMKLEIGASLNEANADALTQIQNVDAPDLDTDYDYRESIYASYAQISGVMPNKIGYNLGVRMENNLVKGKFKTESDLLVDRNITNLFPRANMTIPIDSTKTLSLDYAKSISRPNFSNASSITTFINPFLEFSRNVNLKPVLADELSANFQWKNKSVSISYTSQKNPIYYSIVYSEQENRAIFGPTNLNMESGIDVTVNLPFTHRFWTANNSATLSSRKVEDPAAIVNNTDPYLYYYTNHQFMVAKDTIIAIGGWGLTKRNEGIFERNALFVLEAAISTTFFEKLQCSLRFNDITRTMNFEESYTINGIEANGIFFTDVREVALTVKYAFGKSKEPDYKNKDVDDNLDRIK